MKVALVYGTTEGQTRKIAEFIADRLRDAGLEAALFDAAAAPPASLAAYDGVIVAGSVHVGHYQSALRHFVTEHAKELAARPAAFVSVSLAAASSDPEERKDIEACAARFAKETGWSPQETFHAIGAFRFTAYDFFKKWAMRFIAHQKGVAVNMKEDLELTDWEAVAAFARGFAKRLGASGGRVGP